MRTIASQVSPPPPSLLGSLKAGFDAISNHLVLLLFPISLDLLIWFGPRLRLKRLIESMFGLVTDLNGLGSTQTPGLVEANQEVWQFVAERFNLLASLRSFPVGIPSLMAGRLPLDVPTGAPTFFEIASLGGGLLIWLVLSIAGLAAGTLFFILVSQAALEGKVNVQRAFTDWPWASLQVLFLALFFIAIILAVSLPSSCLVSILALGGMTIGQIAVVFFGAVVLWLLFPLLLSSHAIIIGRLSMILAVVKSVQITRMTLPVTGLLFVSVFLISQLMDMVWRVPNEDSWLTLVGITGHAFVATGLLATTFVYYRNADRWTTGLLAKLRESSLVSPQV